MQKKPSEQGFTLVEVVIAMLLVTTLLAAVIQSVMVARRLTYSNAQRVAAFGMCKARLEAVRGMDYDAVAATNFVAESDLRFVHLSGRDRLPIACTRTVTITPQSTPDRKNVQVDLAWQFMGRPFQEQVIGVVYPK